VALLAAVVGAKASVGSVAESVFYRLVSVGNRRC